MRITVISSREDSEREVTADFPDIPFDYTILVTTTVQLIALLKATDGDGGGGGGGGYDAPVEPPPVPVNRFNPVFN